MIFVFLVEFGVISWIWYLICNCDFFVVKLVEVGIISDVIFDDDDVEDERCCINKIGIDSFFKIDFLFLCNFSKFYGLYFVVKSVCVGVL